MQFNTQRTQALGRIVQDSARLALLLGEAPGREEIIQVQENSLFKFEAQKNALVPEPDRGFPPLPQLLPAAWRERTT